MRKAASKFLSVAALLFLLVNYPLLSAVNKGQRLNGIPVLYLYMGSVWVITIVALYLIARPLRSKNHE